MNVDDNFDFGKNMEQKERRGFAGENVVWAFSQMLNDIQRGIHPERARINFDRKVSQVLINLQAQGCLEVKK